MQFLIKGYDDLKTSTATLCEELQKNGVSNSAVFDCRLVIAELVGNVLKHGNGQASLGVEVTADSLLITVTSSQKFTPPKISRCSGVYAESGRGLFLVDYYSEERTTTSEGSITVKIKR